MILFLKAILVLCFTLTTLSQTLDNKRANQFINAMINSGASLENFVLPEELTISKRLGINYERVKNKFLISYNIPLNITEEIKRNKIDYSLKVEQLDDEFSILHLDVKQRNYNTKYYFKNEYLISPPFYFYNDWIKIESNYFIFYISEPAYFNRYSVDRLEKFISDVFLILNYNEDEIQRLNEEKIIYIRCKDEDEIEKLTGYKARGLFNLAYDYIITTFNCHYHELLHLLINYKLKSLPLFTHPFFQEGFAVGFGGRGGKEAEILLSLGCFLEESGFLKYKELLNADDFKSYDDSMSYPVSSLYNNYLLSQIGIDNYLKYYLKYSADNINAMVISLDDLSSNIEWQKFINSCAQFGKVQVGSIDEKFQILVEESSYNLKEAREFYLIKSNGNMLISTPEKEANYISRIFLEFYPEKNYSGEKYLVRIHDSEIVVYNLFTNNIIANYVSGFTLDMKTVTKEKGFYTFYIKKDLFDEYWIDWEIKILENK